MSKIGLMVYFADDPKKVLDHVKGLGFENIQAGAPSERYFGDPGKRELYQIIEDSQVEVTTMFVSFPEEDYSSIQRIHETGGFISKEFREKRTLYAKQVAELAADLDIPQIAAHIGFIPEDSGDPDYQDLARRIGEIADVCKENGLTFAFETGQEKASTLVGFIKDLGRDNIRVNFDPANMILYGSGDPLEALDLVGPYIGGVHGKDAKWAEPDKVGKEWGTEVPLAEGDAQWEKIIVKLKEIGYTGPITIEREISGDQQIEDVKKAKAFLEARW